MKKSNYTLRTTCRICLNEVRLRPFADLGDQPLADSFVNQGEIAATYPLVVSFCPNCKLVQHSIIIDDSVLFGDDYAFFTGASPSSVDYFRTYAKNTQIRFPEQSAGFVVEIASNDGTLLQHFKGNARDILGIDPATPPANLAITNGVPTRQELFSLNTAMHVVKEYSKANLVLANNVVAHTDKLLDFLAGVNVLLDTNGVFVLEVQYFPHLLFNNAFDHLYHEHRSFFSFTSLNNALEIAGLRAFSVVESDTQGGSIRVFAQKMSGSEPMTLSVESMLRFEDELGLNNVETYAGFQPRVVFLKKKLLQVLEDLKLQGKTVYGLGASAKGNTLLNTFGITRDLVSCIVDKTPYKIGKYAPMSNIPVVADDPTLTPPDYYLVLVWNYLTGILEREKGFRDSGGKLIVPIPSVQII